MKQYFRVLAFGSYVLIALLIADCKSLAATVPDPPTGLAVNMGDTAVSLGWVAPVNNGGSPITGYTINITPSASTTNTINGTAAVVTGLANGTAYTISVSAVNAIGTGAASTPVQATPAAASSANYVNVPVPGDPLAVSGIFDPSVVNDIASNGTVWMAYSSVTASTGDVSTSMAKSLDGGQTFSYIGAIGTANGPVTVTDTAQGTPLQACGGQPSCSGRWVYETPWMIKDPSDPDSTRRYKLFAHKYFNVGSSHWYWLGAIVMWTANSPDGTWSPETPVLGWTLTPPEIPLMKNAGNTLNSIDPTNLNCDAGSEGSTSLDGNGGADFALSCLYQSGSSFFFKPVLLRISNLATLATTSPGAFQYVSTLLTPADAAAISFTAYSTPALLSTQGNAPVLIASPYNGTGLKGCYVFPFASEQAGTLFRDSNNKPIAIAYLPQPGRRNTDAAGGCAWDRGLTGPGIYMNDFPLHMNTFKIVTTKKSL